MRPRARGRGRTPAMSCALLRLAFCAMLAILGSVCFAALWARLCCFGRTDRGLHQPICVLFLGGSEELEEGVQVAPRLFRKGLASLANFCHDWVLIHDGAPSPPMSSSGVQITGVWSPRVALMAMRRRRNSALAM